MNLGKLTIAIDINDARDSLLTNPFLTRAALDAISKNAMAQPITGLMNHKSWFDERWLETSPEKDHIYFWKHHILVKTIADEKDEDGEDIFLYSLFSRYEWERGNRNIDTAKIDEVRFDRSFQSDGVCKYLPIDTFEEVAVNRYELLIPESDLPKEIKIIKSYDQSKDIQFPRDPFV